MVDMNKLSALAREKYKFLDNNNFNIIHRPGVSSNHSSETWRPGDEGVKEYPRPKDFPLDKIGVEVFDDRFTPEDLVGELMHVDPIIQKSTQKLTSTLNRKQLDSIVADSNDYQASIQSGQSPDVALRNALDSFIRGYTTGQWDKESIDALELSDEQSTILNEMNHYIKTGKPLEYETLSNPLLGN